MDQKNTGTLIKGWCNTSVVERIAGGRIKERAQRMKYSLSRTFVSVGVRADSVAVDWLGRNLYWIDGVNSKIVAIRLATGTAKSQDQTVILDEDLDQPRSLALLPQKGSVRIHFN